MRWQAHSVSLASPGAVHESPAPCGVICPVEVASCCVAVVSVDNVRKGKILEAEECQASPLGLPLFGLASTTHTTPLAELAFYTTPCPINIHRSMSRLHTNWMFIAQEASVESQLGWDRTGVGLPDRSGRLGGSGPMFYGTYGFWQQEPSEVACARQDFFASECNLGVRNLVPIRSLPVGSAAMRSSLDSDIRGRHARACFESPQCALSCPVNRDTYVQRWLEESVHEIVRNIQEAPFLQYVFDSNGRLGRSHRQKISKELLKNPGCWSESPLRESLSKVDPDGVILVQKLEPGCPSACCLAESIEQPGNESEMVCPLLGHEGAETNVWGVLVQARGVHANACYLLKTTRVSSSAGICTRYCLTRAQCFGPSYVHQLENAWLL